MYKIADDLLIHLEDNNNDIFSLKIISFRSH